jgi:hypothetical protein
MKIESYQERRKIMEREEEKIRFSDSFTYFYIWPGTRLEKKRLKR